MPCAIKECGSSCMSQLNIPLQFFCWMEEKIKQGGVHKHQTKKKCKEKVKQMQWKEKRQRHNPGIDTTIFEPLHSVFYSTWYISNNKKWRSIFGNLLENIIILFLLRLVLESLSSLELKRQCLDFCSNLTSKACCS